ncbi:TMEM182 [Cervus elaphus hippelaphus]|uniref:TMEM182 n=1 Tax=Cervus elaphus hippelaphus TaxID=46360 RepID=A0A212CWT4_CEREH|nr:TMEM182 [Cervus elaphus hippelaphus]
MQRQQESTARLLHLCSVQIENVTFHHEGFFWRCWFNGIVGENDSNIWQFWYSNLYFSSTGNKSSCSLSVTNTSVLPSFAANQPPWKNCTHAYLSPYPFLRGEHNSTSYDSAVSK